MSMEDGTLKKLELYLHDLHKKIDGIYDMLMLRHERETEQKGSSATNEIVDIPTNKVRIPDTIGKTPITKDDKRVLYSGIPLRKEIELANGRKFTPLLQVNVEQRGVEFVPGSTRQAQGQKQNGDKKQTADKQEQKAEGDTGGQKKQQDPNHWPNGRHPPVPWQGSGCTSIHRIRNNAPEGDAHGRSACAVPCQG
jgi:hypothetical protein